MLLLAATGFFSYCFSNEQNATVKMLLHIHIRSLPLLTYISDFAGHQPCVIGSESSPKLRTCRGLKNFVIQATAATRPSACSKQNCSTAFGTSHFCKSMGCGPIQRIRRSSLHGPWSDHVGKDPRLSAHLSGTVLSQAWLKSTRGVTARAWPPKAKRSQEATCRKLWR